MFLFNLIVSHCRHNVRFFITFFLALCCISLHAQCTFAAQPASFKTIAITQIVAHQSLDKVYKGIVDELAQNGYEEKKSVHIIYKNAQGNMALATQIAQQFINIKPNVIVAIATSSAQAAVNAAKHTSIPIVFASISDPIQAKLVNNLNHPGGNITGTRNVSPIDKQIQLIKQIIPQVKTIGVVLNYGEANSVQLVQDVITNAKAQHIAIQTAAAPTSGEVKSATLHLMRKVDALFLLQDNTIASALPALLSVANDHHIPVFSSYLDAVKNGALAGLAFDEYTIGQQTGKIIVKILQGQNPGDIPVQDPTNIELGINLATAKKLKINIPSHLLTQAKFIYPEQAHETN